MISDQISTMQISESSLESICEHLREVFEEAFKGLYLVCPLNLPEVIKALVDTCKAIKFLGKAKIEVNLQNYEKLQKSDCLFWPDIELAVNPELKDDQCRLYCSNVFIEYDKKSLELELQHALASAKFTYSD